jgi:antirestriction protein
MAKHEITNQDDIIDSRYVIERIDTLEADENRTEEETAELAALKALQEEGECSPDWRYGETLIRYDYFKEYAQQLAEDTGAIRHETSWPYTCIDWERAARELKMDYTAVYFGGIEYFIRS